MLHCLRVGPLLPIALSVAAIWRLCLLPSAAELAEPPATLERTARIIAPIEGATSSPPARSAPATGAGKPALFFGYVEFDVDPDAPGGVPGFGRWPQPSPPLAMTGPVR